MSIACGQIFPGLKTCRPDFSLSRTAALRLRAASLLAAMWFLQAGAWSETAGFGAGFPHSISVSQSGGLVTYSNLPVTNVTGATFSNLTTPT